jgi:hypothetical protein
MTEYLDMRARARVAEVVQINPDLSPIDYLLAKLRDPTTEPHLRTRIAIALLPFTVDKLQAAAISVMSQDFAARLEKAMLRSAKVRLIAEQPAQGFKRRF